MKKRTMRWTKLFALVVAVVMCVTVFPVTGGKASAEARVSPAIEKGKGVGINGVTPSQTTTKDATDTYAEPNYNGVFDVYSTYFTYYPFTVGGNVWPFWLGRQTYIRLEISDNNWANWLYSSPIYYNGYTTANTIGRTITSLRPNTTYRTRICYCDYYGNRLSPYRYTTTIVTGQPKAPKIKKVTVKAVKVKYHKHRVRGHYEFTAMGYPIWIRPYTERYYTYKLKVTVKLKKKSTAPGLFIALGGVGSKYIAGKKKTYTATFSPYPNYRTKRPPKGLGKKTVSIATYRSKSWGGYSPLTSRKRKVR